MLTSIMDPIPLRSLNVLSKSFAVSTPEAQHKKHVECCIRVYTEQYRVFTCLLEAFLFKKK